MKRRRNLVKFWGFRDENDHCIVLVNTGEDAWANLPFYLDEYFYYQKGFEWGSYGPGPLQLAHAIVSFMSEGSKVDKDDLYQLAVDFKWLVIGDFKKEGWEYHLKNFKHLVNWINTLRELE